MAWYYCLVISAVCAVFAGFFFRLVALTETDAGAILGMGFVCLFAIAAGLVWLWYSPYPGHACLASHDETSYVYVSAGKGVGVMEPFTDSVCDRWSK